MGEKAALLRQERECEDYRIQENSENYVNAGDDAEKEVARVGLWSEWARNHDLRLYPNLQIKEILNSESTVIRAIGMFDKRVGRRRLKSLELEKKAPIVKLYFEIRCELEGINLDGRESS